MRRSYLFVVAMSLLLSACGSEGQRAEGPLVKEKQREFVRQTLGSLKDGAMLVLFTTQSDCEYCDLTEQLLTDVATLSAQVTLEVLSLEKEATRAEELGIDKAPGIAILGKKDYGIRYYGFPTGYEFITLIEAIRQVGNGDPGLQEKTLQTLSTLQEPVTLTVFSSKA